MPACWPGSLCLIQSDRPGHLAPVSLPRADGEVRLLHVPVVRDRVVERSILAVLNPVIDPWLGPFSYAYRPGLGVADTVQAVARLRDEGLGWGIPHARTRGDFGPLLSRKSRAASWPCGLPCRTWR